MGRRAAAREEGKEGEFFLFLIGVGSKEVIG